jgi:hypothetical protein
MSATIFLCLSKKWDCYSRRSRYLEVGCRGWWAWFDFGSRLECCLRWAARGRTTVGLGRRGCWLSERQCFSKVCRWVVRGCSGISSRGFGRVPAPWQLGGSQSRGRSRSQSDLEVVDAVGAWFDSTVSFFDSRGAAPGSLWAWLWQSRLGFFSVRYKKPQSSNLFHTREQFL